MNKFFAHFSSRITGVLSGFDRMVFRGYLLSIAFASGFRTFLSYQDVLLKDFSRYVQNTTELLKEASLASAYDLQRPIQYINSASINKEQLVRKILAEDPVKHGLICVLSSVEPCSAYEVHRNRELKRLEMKRTIRKCLHLYHYFLDPEFGFMSARIQTWFPFDVQICLNGRTWLAKQMDRAGINYHQLENCFTWIENLPRAQELMKQQLSISWPQLLDRIGAVLNPAHTYIFRERPQHYYWCLHQSEWATDVMFKDSTALAEIYPKLSLHAITKFSSPDVMRFLGQKVHHAFKGEIVSDFKNRLEGIRVKHRVKGNSVKMYDKAGCVLRVETTLNHPKDLKVFRPKQGDPEEKLAWLPLRKGVADIHRRAKLSEDSNMRYLDTLGTIEDRTPVGQIVKDICRPTSLKGKRVRALRPWSDADANLIRIVIRGEFAVTGFRNRDIRRLLYPGSESSPIEDRRRSSSTTRLLRILRAHGVIKKIPKTHRYQVAKQGRLIITAVLAARDASVAQLTTAA